LKLRDYQSRAVESILADLTEGKSTLAVLPTGTGKTVVFGHVADQWSGRTGKRILVLAHREELIFQARDKIAAVTGLEPEIEMGEFRASGRSLYRRSPIVVSSVQTQNAGRRCFCREASDDTVGGQITGCANCIGGIIRRMQNFRPEDFGLIIVDEAHHSTAESYRRIMRYYGENPAVQIMGVTATPDRADEVALGKVYDSVSFDYELPDAIRDGWLVPIVQEFVECSDLDFSQIKTTAGDLNGAELERVMTEEHAIHSVVTPTLEIAGDRTVLFFAASVAHAELMADVLNRHRPRSALCITGATPTELRRHALKAFSKGHYQYLTGCGVFLEGFDEPRIQVVAMARPTKSRTLYAQAVGRGTRPALSPTGETAEARRAEIAASGKPSVLVLDFAGNSGRHKLISTADILGGRYDDDVVELAVAKAKAEGRQVDMTEQLAEAAAEIQERKADERRAQIKAEQAKFSRRQVDPFEVFDLIPEREPGWFKGKTPTQRQAEALARFGVPTDDIATMSLAKASQVLPELMRRRRENLCSYKQAKVLRRYGEPVDVTFDQANAVIDQIKANGWKPLREPGAVRTP
jgi:superfamily II DNA or RNA helicase